MIPRVHCRFLNAPDWRALQSYFAKHGGEVMLLAQRHSGEKEYEYQLWVRESSTADPAIARIEWPAQRIVEENVRVRVTPYWEKEEWVELGNVVLYIFTTTKFSPAEIREKIEEALPGIGFDNWDSILMEENKA